MDGSDGEPDLRMDMTPGSQLCGTFVRTLAKGSDGELTLVKGTIEQPPPASAQTSAEIEEFYKASDLKVQLIAGAMNAALHLKSQLQGGGRTLALRDYYPGNKSPHPLWQLTVVVEHRL